MYESGMSQTEIAREFGCSQTLIGASLRRQGKRGREMQGGHKAGESHPSWKGGRAMHPSGYWMVKNYDPQWSSMETNQGYVLEHRLVMAQSLGRPLTDTETVHHINGDKLDNRLANLRLHQGKHGKGVAMICGDCGSHNLITTPIKE